MDTDWTINYLNGIQMVVRKLNGFLPQGVGISVISIAELYDGISGEFPQGDIDQELGDFLAYIEIVPLDDGICRIFARERRRLRAAGNIISDFDLLIGSTALRHNLTLLTNNHRHFRRMQGLNIVSE